MHEFGWFGEGPSPPAQWDLRRAGWHLAREAQAEPSSYPILVAGMPHERLDEVVGHEWIVLLGVDDAEIRARRIAEGFGDALASSLCLAELAARAERIFAHAGRVPRRRELGPVTLDLFHRDALVAGRWIGLFPREFELLWCLAEHPGARLSRLQLLKEVWRLNHDPETNRVEVHVSRLRAKLAFAGVGDLIGTGPAGGYFVRHAAITAQPAPRGQFMFEASARTLA